MTRRDGPAQGIQARRDDALAGLVAAIPYAAWLGTGLDRRGGELTAIMRYDRRPIGNPALPALRGRAIAAFPETTAIIELIWAGLWAQMETLPASGTAETRPEAGAKAKVGEGAGALPRLPKAIDFSVDFLRAGLARDAYARASVVRQGWRYASVHVGAWQDNRARPFAQAAGHFLTGPAR